MTLRTTPGSARKGTTIALLPGMAALCTLTFALLQPASCQAQTDVPGRVAQVNYMNGAVTFSTGSTNNWQYVNPNQPLTSGDHLWIDQNGAAEMHIGSTSLQLASQTSLDLISVTDNDIHLSLVQGTLHLRIRDYPENQSIEVDTPDLTFTVQQPGDYKISTSPNAQNSFVIVRDGSGFVSSSRDPNMSMTRGQQVTVWGNSQAPASFTAAPPYNSFDQWAAQRIARDEQSISAQYVSRETAGYEALDSNGDWRNDPRYGAIWVPRLTVANWAPYHAGHWAYIDPWGWTWIDDMPWGFATFHYGRWALIDQQWCWVPGERQQRPYYAPALVGFVGGVSINVALSGGHGNVAWFPLAPGEAYRPAYAASPAYIQRINGNIRYQETMIGHTPGNVRDRGEQIFINQRIGSAITSAPGASFATKQGLVPTRQATAPGMIPPATNRNTPGNPSNPGSAPGNERIIERNADHIGERNTERNGERNTERYDTRMPERNITAPANPIAPTSRPLPATAPIAAPLRSPLAPVTREVMPPSQNQGQGQQQSRQQQPQGQPQVQQGQIQGQGNQAEHGRNGNRSEVIPTAMPAPAAAPVTAPGGGATAPAGKPHRGHEGDPANPDHGNEHEHEHGNR